MGTYTEYVSEYIFGLALLAPLILLVLQKIVLDTWERYREKHSK